MGILDTLFRLGQGTGGMSLPVGDPRKTIHMRKLYNQYAIQTQSSGQPALPWNQWLESQGFTVDSTGNVIPLGNQNAQGF